MSRRQHEICNDGTRNTNRVDEVFSCSVATVQQRTIQNFLGVRKLAVVTVKIAKYLKTNQKLMVAYRMSISTFLLSISFEQSVEML